MGNVGITYKIYLEADADPKQIVEFIRSWADVRDWKVEELGFGIRVLKLLLITEDKGGTEEVDNKISSINGVSQLEVESVTLI